MPKVLCTLPNASEEISGVKFVKHALGMLSEDVSHDVANHFASITGYELVGGTQFIDPSEAAAEASAAAARQEAADKAAAAAEEAAKVAKAEADAKAAADKAAADEVAKVERAAKVAKAEALGVNVKGNWGDARLDSEIEAAEKAKVSQPADQDKAPEADGQPAQ